METLDKGQRARQPAHPDLTLDRRQLLKALIAAGGATMASTLLPGEWASPVVEVGVLPAHAQTSAVVYTLYCDSTPGGGDITLGGTPGTGNIYDIIATLQVLSGQGPVDDIDIEMRAVPDSSDPLPTFTPSLPIHAETDSGGAAAFGDLAVNGQPGQSFYLEFECQNPVNQATHIVVCGRYDLS